MFQTISEEKKQNQELYVWVLMGGVTLDLCCGHSVNCPKIIKTSIIIFAFG